MKEVVEVVKRVSGIDFPVVVSGRRAGDPAAIVAKAERAKAVLGWKPTRDNLDEIVRQALDWERRLHNRQTEGLSKPLGLAARRRISDATGPGRSN